MVLGHWYENSSFFHSLWSVSLIMEITMLPPTNFSKSGCRKVLVSGNRVPRQKAFCEAHIWWIVFFMWLFFSLSKFLPTRKIMPSIETQLHKCLWGTSVSFWGTSASLYQTQMSLYEAQAPILLPPNMISNNLCCKKNLHKLNVGVQYPVFSLGLFLFSYYLPHTE